MAIATKKNSRTKAGPVELHRSEHIGWLRAAVLGANDGLVSTASLMVGVAAARTSSHNILVAGGAGLIAGAMSMAAGEYVSVSSQADTENADLNREKDELKENYQYEIEELAQIYVKRGLDNKLAREVAEKLMAQDALGTHAREELGIVEIFSARPIQAAFASAASFAVGAALPLAIVLIFSGQNLILYVSTSSLLFLILLGVAAAKIGGANVWLGAFRVGFWGALAIAITAGAGLIFGMAF